MGTIPNEAEPMLLEQTSHDRSDYPTVSTQSEVSRKIDLKTRENFFKIFKKQGFVRPVETYNRYFDGFDNAMTGFADDRRRISCR